MPFFLAYHVDDNMDCFEKRSYAKLGFPLFLRNQDQINCGLCKKRRKNAVLTKCFHVFCMECIKVRWPTLYT